MCAVFENMSLHVRMWVKACPDDFDDLWFVSSLTAESVNLGFAPENEFHLHSMIVMGITSQAPPEPSVKVL